MYLVQALPERNRDAMIVSYNGSEVKIFSPLQITSQVLFDNKNIFFYFEKRSSQLYLRLVLYICSRQISRGLAPDVKR
jgi:hypothetical protein